ncbi:STAS domain-containing protein [Sporosarcina highlanderae]|uniref:Anti-sigma factor antagonist n=1 Tax=Sporosarcina highlanderae TaxID=3035916 RepID=A0ABT8JME8_9BACL|nr:STAS domain-containing protein [Sporosarcina highlanderae]MDN4606321.1 STAS domain-containing protein [Sporosarcina highlanderae]
MNLQVNILEDNSVQYFKVVGEIDAFTAPVLKERLATVQSVQGLKAQLDLSEVDYMDSTGLGVFVGFYKAVTANGGHVKITGLNRRLNRLFEITGLDEIIDIEMRESEDNDGTI